MLRKFPDAKPADCANETPEVAPPLARPQTAKPDRNNAVPTVIAHALCVKSPNITVRKPVTQRIGMLRIAQL